MGSGLDLPKYFLSGVVSFSVSTCLSPCCCCCCCRGLVEPCGLTSWSRTRVFLHYVWLHFDEEGEAMCPHIRRNHRALVSDSSHVSNILSYNTLHSLPSPLASYSISESLTFARVSSNPILSHNGKARPSTYVKGPT